MTTSPREQALLLRLAAAEIAEEPHSIFVLRRIMRDLGWTDAAMDASVARVRGAVAQSVATQARLWAA